MQLLTSKAMESQEMRGFGILSLLHLSVVDTPLVIKIIPAWFIESSSLFRPILEILALFYEFVSYMLA